MFTLNTNGKSLQTLILAFKTCEGTKAIESINHVFKYFSDSSLHAYTHLG